MSDTTEYRHITNLRVPFDRSDLQFLASIEDYRIGAPVSAGHKTAYSDEQLREAGIIGLYVAAGPAFDQAKTMIL
jgi:hypothetical protein